MNNKQPIFVGITQYDELYFVEIKQPTIDYNYFSITGTTVSVEEAEQAEQFAREQLEDGDYWKMAVEAGDTELGLNDWVESVLNTDGWESMHDFDYDLSPVEYKDKEYYFSFSAAGQHQEKLEDMKELFISKEDFRVLMNTWDKYHLKKQSVKLPQSLTQPQDKNTILQKTIQNFINNNY